MSQTTTSPSIVEGQQPLTRINPRIFLLALGMLALGAPLGTWIGEKFGWRLSFLMVAVLAGLAFLLLVICGLPKSAALAPLSLKERLKPITQPHVILVLFPALLWNVGGYVMYPYI